MIVARIAKFSLAPAGRNKIYSQSYEEEVKGWLSQWTCKNNFEAVLATDKEAALIVIKKQLDNLFKCMRTYKAEDFAIELAIEHVGEDGTFWYPSFVNCIKYRCSNLEIV